MNNFEKYINQKGEVIAAVVLATCMALGIVIMTNIKPEETIEELPIAIQTPSGEIIQEKLLLPTFSSKEEILEKVAQKRETEDGYIFDFVYEMDMAVPESAINSTVKGETLGSLDSALEKDYSETNTQVKGVDEADIVKTNGDYIYYLSRGNLYVFETKTNKPKLAKTINIENTNRYSMQEMYIDKNYIIVLIEESIERDVYKEEKIGKDKLAENRIYPTYYSNGTTMYVYDINSYELVKKVTTEGSYISSRKIENNVYVVTNKYLYPYSVNEDNVLPIYREINYLKTASENEEYKEIPATEICYFPDMEEKKECNYMLITSLNLNEMDEEVNIETFLGAGNEIYCSKENLYVTKIEYNYTNYVGGRAIMIDTIEFDESFLETDSENVESEEETVTTRIHKFKLLDGSIEYMATGSVSGSLLNQYSMDEYNGNFRITTTGNSGNNLYVLNENLETVGTLKNLARGEKIYATRFMGEKCYLVTYKTVDPLFVIDLSEPTNPIVLGELKIPGYSTYLHPLGENYLIGFGEDSVEKTYLNWRGEQEVTAYNVGMKLAIFDVSDVNNPKEIHSVKIGGRGSSSELLYNPKVLYFDEEKEIFAFPATLTEETKFYQDGTPMYGDVIFEGALVYDLSVENGIKLRGQIEHEKATQKYNENTIERIISIRDDFYTLSPNMLKVTNMKTMEEVNNVSYNVEEKYKENILKYIS